MSRKLYIGTKFQPSIKDMENEYDYKKRLEEYESNPFTMFFCKDNIEAIREANKIGLKDLAIINHIWSK